jgi:hypothetical protein
MRLHSLVVKGKWRLTVAIEDDKHYLNLWHLHPEREKKQGLVSDGRKCMDCDEVSPTKIGGFDVEPDGYVVTEWEKELYATSKTKEK